MPAVSVENTLALPRLDALVGNDPHARPVTQVVHSHSQLEGAGFEINRPFPGGLPASATTPFLLLDHLGPQLNGPGEASGAPWHPHRGFETVTYVLDGEISHHDTNGGGGVIGAGDTQWMTAGSGILHDELPTERAFREGGPSHGVQLWVNLPAALKMTPPRYQSITADSLTLLTSPDGGSLVRLIAGDLGGYAGPGNTHTPITYVHATVARGAELVLPWNPGFTAMVFVLTGQGSVGPEQRPVAENDLALMGGGDRITIRAADHIEGGYDALDVLVLGGMPINEPVVQYGPFVMNTREEIQQAIDDFNAGRMGVIPADQMAPRRFS
ncbi:MAG: putative pirin family protein [Actinomycetia bacterium]|nr:putative pirin family protein [Actinomycetes bacterium]